MFGREPELERIAAALDTRGPQVLGLEGAPGIGKSTLWRRGLELARERGWRVLASAPAEPDAALAFAGLADLLDDLDARQLDDLPAPQRQALRAALYLEDAPPSDPHAVSRGVLGFVRRLAEARPLVIAIDDEQWLDGASARVLAFALTRLSDERVTVLLARRPASGGTLYAALEHGAGLQTLALAPLPLDALGAVIEGELGLRVPRPRLRRIHALSGGNPLYALQLARSPDLAVPPTLAQALERRLEALDPRTAQPLLVVAALRQPTAARLRAAGFDPADLDDAERARVIEARGERLGFTHPLLASVHYARCPAGERRALHRRLAGVAADAEERAHHLALGADGPDEAIAATVEHAAHDAAARGAPETAAELLDHAARLSPEPEVRARRSVDAAAKHLQAGSPASVRAALEPLIPELAAGALRARARLLLARIRTDDMHAACKLFGEALRDAGDDHRLRAEIERLLAEQYANLGDQASAARHARSAVEAAEGAGDLGLVATALAGESTMALFRGEGIRRAEMERAVALERHARAADPYHLPSTSLGLQLLWSDDIGPARPLLERGLRLADEAGHEHSRCGLLVHLAHAEWVAGDIEAALRHGALADAEAAQLGDLQLDGFVGWLRAFGAWRRGRLDDAIEHALATAARAERAGDAFIVMATTVIAASADVAAARPADALERLASVKARQRESGVALVGTFVLDGWVAEAEAMIALGRNAEAEITAISKHGRRASNPLAEALAWRLRGQLLGARGEHNAALAAFERALEAHALRPVPFERGRTLLEQGSVERRARRKAAAKVSLEAALAELEPLDAAVWVERARDELGRVGLRRAAGEGLTPAQQRVAQLVAAGMTNREIAAATYMSLRTVESHLTRVYRELGVRSRSQLTERLTRASSS